MNTKRLFLFAQDEKNFTNLRFRTAAIRHSGAVTLWTMAFRSMTHELAEDRMKSDF
jgi:hypothetical protein